MASNRRIYIVDDHPLMRKGLALTIDNEPGFDVCGQAESAEIALDEILATRPDAAVVDISLPGMNGIEFIKNILHQMPDLKILVVSRHDEELYAERALRAGAKGYLMKLEATETLLTALRQILDGGIYLSQSVSNKILLKVASGNKPLVSIPRIGKSTSVILNPDNQSGIITIHQNPDVRGISMLHCVTGRFLNNSE